MNQALPALKKEDYILSFKVHGVSVFMTDISRDMYRDLAALYIVHEGTYFQYFRKSHFEHALDEGVGFFSNAETWKNYKQKIQDSAHQLEKLFTQLISDSQAIDKSATDDSFKAMVTFLRLYSRMDFEYTDKAYSLGETNPIIAKNLEDLAVFKDVMRAFINKAFSNQTVCWFNFFTNLNANLISALEHYIAIFKKIFWLYLKEYGLMKKH